MLNMEFQPLDSRLYGFSTIFKSSLIEGQPVTNTGTKLHFFEDKYAYTLYTKITIHKLPYNKFRDRTSLINLETEQIYKI